MQADLRDDSACRAAAAGCDTIYDLAADMGGLGFIESNPVACMSCVVIGANLLRAADALDIGRFFFSSSACVYPQARQRRADIEPIREEEAFPADPEPGYGWEKVFTEQLALEFHRERGLDVRIARYHNVYGPNGAWTGGREKAPAAICRKVATAELTGSATIEVWGTDARPAPSPGSATASKAPVG